MISEKDDSIIDAIKKQHEKDREISEKHHKEIIKDQKKQSVINATMLILAIAALMISYTAFQDSNKNTALIGEIQKITEAQFNAEHFMLPQAKGGDIFIENTFLPFFNSNEGITVSAVTRDDVQFEVTNATLLYTESTFSKCFFSKSPTINLVRPEYVILKSNVNNEKIIPMLRMDYSVSGAFIGGNQSGNLQQFVVGTVQYDMLATDLHTNHTSPLQAYSTLVASLPLNRVQYIEKC